jgi:hypothetical protein
MALRRLPPLKHIAGVVHEHGSQWCRRCGHLLRSAGAVCDPSTPGAAVSRTEPCRVDRAPRFRTDQRKDLEAL